MAQGFHVTTDRCYGCKTCTVACANEHLLEPGVLLRRVRQINISEPIGHAFVSMSCNHCESPACVANCPVGAYTKQEDTGLVLQDHDLCIGCKMCTEVCPFSAPAYDEEESKTYKCDACIARAQEGLAPVCTLSCPSNNISFGEFDQMLALNGDTVSVKDTAETEPNLAVVLDPDIPINVFSDIDSLQETVDPGGEDY